MNKVKKWKEKVLQGENLSRQEALLLAEEDLEELCLAADAIREHFCGKNFDLCTIVNGKNGACSEDCKFCAQSSHYMTTGTSYPLLPAEELLRQARYNEERGVLRYSVVTSGRSLSEEEVENFCQSLRLIRQQTRVSLCVSLGLLTERQFQKLKAAGVVRVHNNLETARAYFPQVCTTHTYEDKLASIRAARAAGLEVCSGGIVGLGESMADRIDLALELRRLEVSSIPLNRLSPIPGTPYQDNPPMTESELRRIVALFRFLLPRAFLRLAGGRGMLSDKGMGCLQAGANAMISGDMLTTAGVSIQTDLHMVKSLGYEVVQP